MDNGDDSGLAHRLSDLVYMLVHENNKLHNDITQLWHDFDDKFDNQLTASVATSRAEHQARSSIWHSHALEIFHTPTNYGSYLGNDSEDNGPPELQDVSDSEDEQELSSGNRVPLQVSRVNVEDANHVEVYADDVIYAFDTAEQGNDRPAEPADDGILYDWWETYDGVNEPDPELSYGMRIQHEPDETLYVLGESRGQRAAMQVTGQAKACPELPSWCVTISGTINGLKATILLDSGSSINAMSPLYATVGDISAFPLNKLVGLQLGCVGSRSKINFGTQQTLTIGERQFHTYFDIVNLDHYDIVLGIPFMKMNQVILDFTHNVIRCGADVVPTMEGDSMTPQDKAKAKDKVHKHTTPKSE
jgi:hypothetical protein